MNGQVDDLQSAGATEVLPVWRYLRLILATPVPKVRTPDARHVKWDPKIRVAPWIKEDFPELAGDELPPPLDYFYDAVSPNTVRWKNLFDPRLSPHGRKMGWVRLLASWAVVGVVLWVMLDNRGFLPLMYIVIFGGMLAIQAMTHVHRPTVPLEIWFTRNAEAVQELAITPLTGRDLFLGQAVRTIRSRRLRWVGVLMGFAFGVFFFVYFSRFPNISLPALGAFVVMGLALVNFYARYADGVTLVTVYWTLVSPLDRVVFRKGWTRDQRRARRRFKLATLVLVVPATLLMLFFIYQIGLVFVRWRFAVPLLLFEAVILLVLARSPLVRLGQKLIRARVRWGMQDVDHIYRALRERQLQDIEAGRPISGVRGRGRFMMQNRID